MLEGTLDVSAFVTSNSENDQTTKGFGLIEELYYLSLILEFYLETKSFKVYQ